MPNLIKKKNVLEFSYRQEIIYYVVSIWREMVYIKSAAFCCMKNLIHAYWVPRNFASYKEQNWAEREWSSDH